MGRTAVQPYTAVLYAVHVMPADPRSERESREHAASCTDGTGTAVPYEYSSLSRTRVAGTRRYLGTRSS